MLRRLVALVAEETGKSLDLAGYFKLFSESEYISIWSHQLDSAVVPSGLARSEDLGTALLSRHVYNRAFALAARFIDGLEGLPEQDRQETRQLQWDVVVAALHTDEGRTAFAAEIQSVAVKLAGAIPELRSPAKELRVEHILIDFPINKTVVRGNDILTRTEAGEVVPPNLFFDPEKWSQALRTSEADRPRIRAQRPRSSGMPGFKDSFLQPIQPRHGKSRRKRREDGSNHQAGVDYPGERPSIVFCRVCGSVNRDETKPTADFSR